MLADAYLHLAAALTQIRTGFASSSGVAAKMFFSGGFAGIAASVSGDAIFLHFIRLLQHAPKNRAEAARFLELLFGSPPHPLPLIRPQRTFAVFLIKELPLLQLHLEQEDHMQQKQQQLHSQQQTQQQQQQIRKLLKQRGFYILWEREMKLDKEAVGLLCQVGIFCICQCCCWRCHYFRY